MPYISRIDEIQSKFRKRKVSIDVPKSDFPELIVTVPDSWPYINLRPLYDVHVGNHNFSQKRFEKDMAEMVADPYLLSWDGGDVIENVVEGSPGIFVQRGDPDAQFDLAAEYLAPLQHKLLFKIPGNHEARTYRIAGFNLSARLADNLKLPHFSDYCFCTLRWRGNNFRIVAHHGSGASATPGGQRNAARKDMPWTRADFYWTGHLHQPIIDPVFQTDVDQKTSRIVTRCALVIISPSYVEYFGGYAASKRLGPGIIGAHTATLRPNGDISATLVVKGKRL